MASEKKARYFFKNNVTTGKVIDGECKKFEFNRGDLCPPEFEKEMIEAKQLAKEEPEAINPEAKINLVKKSKMPDMASRG